MPIDTQALRYGWVALASLGVLTGVTIFVANNMRKTVRAEDVIEIVLGTHERCLATQYQTNPVAYRVAPLDVVRTWYSNVYDSNGVSVYTNIVTNTIGWGIDRQMLIDVDAKIADLVPYFYDTNNVFDLSSNTLPLTVTGLWASLGIGDGTNQFTRRPGWTNGIATNWIINYTNYWPSTNGTATNINYTSHYQQVVNYAQSWSATGGHVWVNYSNWPTEVTQTTNAPIYGSYPWQIYAEDLVERYKVLNALKMSRVPPVYGGAGPAGQFYQGKTAYGANYTHLLSEWSSASWDWGGGTLSWGSFGNKSPSGLTWEFNRAAIYLTNLSFSWDTNLTWQDAHLFGVSEVSFGSLFLPVTNRVYFDMDYGSMTTQMFWVADFVYPDHALGSVIEGDFDTVYAEAVFQTHTAVGYNVRPSGFNVYINWIFNYCTNKFW